MGDIKRDAVDKFTALGSRPFCQDSRKDSIKCAGLYSNFLSCDLHQYNSEISKGLLIVSYNKEQQQHTLEKTALHSSQGFFVESDLSLLVG
ncbi:hypothetical protein SADUNF_Sadunf02G0097800 [Salix dunnii]|uniref:Uncharacterized protein n=1 Tax=Salix dunnii TaxID=1413687 RepID=A0A835THB3_9ROSI|nr:hypothetical protein SADUNF_Sadunf02G0097800 [Salix dunnii]